MRWPAAFCLALAGLLATGPWQAAQAQTITTCSPASTKGADGPVDYGAYCWIDFSPLNVSQAESGGQDFQVNLPGGVATLTFTLNITGDANGLLITSAAVPSYTNAAFGNFAFNGIPGKPIIYQTNTNGGSNTTATLTNVTLNANGTTDLPFVFVAADGESTNGGTPPETLSLTTSGDPWELVASPGLNEGYTTPTLSYSNGNKTVLETGTGSGLTTSYVFTTDNSPGTVQATMYGTGLQGALFGVKYHTIGLSLTKTHVGDFKVGGTGSYTINVSNTVITPTINPPSDPQPVRVVDTLPTGLTYASASGSGWSCSNAGQVVTCDTTTLQDLTSSKTFPPITVNVTVDSDAPATLTNMATASDPTTSTLVFNVCEVAANGVCPGSATSTDGDATTILHPDLSTSTKTVVDVNGGDAEPGDTLEYTITLKETGGMAASNVNVTDDMPANVDNFTITNNAGGTDTSSTTGGANSTGQLDISGINVPANGSKTIVYDVRVKAGTAAGTTIDNTATIDNPNGSGATPAAPTITVSLSQIPVVGNKLLYVYDDLSLTRTPQAVNGSGVTIDGSGNTSANWTLTQPLSNALTLVGGSTISINLMVECGGGNCKGNGDSFTAALYDKNGAALTQIGGTSLPASFEFSSYTLSSANITVPAAGYTIASGHQLQLLITNVANKSNRPMSVEQYVNGQRSTVSLNVSGAIQVQSVQTNTKADCTGSTVTSVYETNSTVYICAVVSDAFGSTDIDPAGGTAPTITITDANGTQQLSPTGMAPTTPLTPVAPTRTFGYTYAIPKSLTASLALGAWTASVTAWEGTEGTMSHTAKGGFEVGAPDLVVVKSVSVVSNPVEGTTNPKALPGATMRYSIIITNQGKGAVDNNQLVVTDAIPVNTDFVVGSVTGSGAGSGVSTLTPSDISYSDDSGNTWTYTPTAGADGTDPNVTNIKFSPQGSMAGKTGATAPAYTITFEVKIQ
ncbi:MAG TPA: CshA/CshB family fibrillar adhesin-related protein [Oleiagrimonas sp.]|nr:CshA/CshB family fibrillar adhesin-related protein [Oleiagrimonas sp.]